MNEVNRLGIIQRVRDHTLLQREAARLFELTVRFMHLRFCQSESALDYMVTARGYLDKHGKPVAFYSDKHAWSDNGNPSPLKY